MSRTLIAGILILLGVATVHAEVAYQESKQVVMPGAGRHAEQWTEPWVDVAAFQDHESCLKHLAEQPTKPRVGKWGEALTFEYPLSRCVRH